ncbi:M48 family metalloprotease [Micromonospora sp. NPDC049497]|uniref:M48 family metalloprotease n=1 Tax=Micromonospora sp. NPDC049497 TaxID=3364273 RepID=UPI0037B119EC
MTPDETERVAPAPLAWLYLLVAALVTTLGVALGNLFFHAHRPLANEYALALTRCDRVFPGYPFTAPERNLETANGFIACISEPSRALGWTLLAGAALLLAGLAALLMLVPMVDALRLRRRRVALTVPGAEERFAALCTAAGLAGRQRPRLLVAGPPVRQAFTTALPGGRPLVVLPAAVALAHADSARFDPVIRHELAHVQARDVAWVSTLRGLPWVVVPPVLAVAAGNIGTARVVVLPPLIRALILVAAVALLAAALLRLREHAADRLVGADIGPGMLAAILARAPAPAAGPLRRARRAALGRHPSPAARVAALTGSRPPLDAGFTHAFATTAVTVGAMGAAMAVTQSLDVTGDPKGPAAAVGGLLLGLGLVPALHRRAAAARRSGSRAAWWRPVAGATAGFVVGAILLPVAALPDAVAFPGGATDARSAVTYAAVTTVAGVALTVLCVFVARLLADTSASAGVRGRVLRGATYLAVALTVTAVVWAVPVAAQALQQPRDQIHDWLVFSAPVGGWSMTSLAAPLACALLLRAAAGRGWWVGPALASAGAALAAGAVAVVHAARHRNPTLVELMALYQDQQWTAALAGWAILIALGMRRARHSEVIGIVAAWATTATVGTGLYLHSLLAGYPASMFRFRLLTLAPLVWLLYLTIVTLPALAAVSALRRTPAPGPLPSEPAVEPWSARLAWPASTATVLAGILVLLVNGPAGGVLRAPGTAAAAAAAAGDVPPSAPASPAPTTRAGSSAPSGATDPRRPLTAAETETAARAVAPALPAYWQAAPAGTDADNPVEPASCLPFARTQFLDPLKPTERADSVVRYQTRPGPAALASTSLTVGVTSYAEPIPPTVLAAAETARAACPRFRTPGKLPISTEVTAGAAPALGEQGWRVDLRLAATSDDVQLTGTSAYVLIRVGHNLVSASMTAIMEPLDEELLRQALQRTAAALSAPSSPAPSSSPAAPSATPTR